MRNIRRIFVRDVRQATRNVIALIVALGLIVVPSLYAWYNIAASWDPYGNTKALKVAVANVDEGYKSDLMPVEINVGETVISALRANDALDWQFVGKDEALDGVNSGDYYAALIIPKTFSADMMTVFSPNIEHAKLEYYLNEEINPIAPHITDKGASTVATTIDQTFVKTIGEVALDLASNMVDYTQSPQMAQYVNNATEHIGSLASNLRSAAAQMDAYAGLMGSIGGIIDSTDELLGTTGSTAADAKTALGQGRDGMTSLGDALSGAMDSVGDSLDKASGAYDDVKTQLGKSFDAIGDQSDQLHDALTDMQTSVNDQAKALDEYADSLRRMADSLGGSSEAGSDQTALDTLRAALNAAADQASAAAKRLRETADGLGEAAQQVADGKADAQQTRAQLADKLDAAKQQIDDVRSSYRSTLEPQVEALASSLDDLSSQVGTVIDGLSSALDGVDGLTGDLGSQIDTARKAMADAASSLTDSADKLDRLSGKLTSTLDDGGENLSALVSGTDADTIATLISAPVRVDRVAVYPVENYGSAMTPFYTILSIWVGSIILVAMLKVAVSDHEKAKILGLGNDLPLGARTGLRDAMVAGRVAGPAAALDVLMKPRAETPGNARQFGLKLHHEYFGRYLIFAVFALLQATLVCLGDVFYLGAQCESLWRFLLAGWLAAIVFSNIMYTLTVSFGDIGKAIAVVLLVMQVAGSGGTFPIETLPWYFQAVAKFLMFPYGVDAMHAAMAGSYGNEYWIAMGKLALFLIPSLLLGLVLRKPVIRLNNWIIHNLESTKVM
ncbi:YhgE/Pip domain-containing protein [Bifidobacterium samirii]|uniref:ABC-2 type transporter n=1 Tax=Bifidobacterium samirii TaxID=2306974 RepID=A0A430FV04_9BIFI|nr:YhgE/Pip domain-containing protein [Bifidobacterium samirii]RSX57398.1 ABC-2 type transporter [Bifidobacterium samirii]